MRGWRRGTRRRRHCFVRQPAKLLLLLPLLLLLLLRADTRWAVAAQALVLVLRAGYGQP